MEKKLDFIGIGVVKAASTWIYECLKDHPEICVSKKKELHFFNDDYNYSKGLEYYISFFNHCPKESKKGEYTPSYISSMNASLRIKKAFPEIKLIICLRDPVDRAISEFNFQKRMKGSLSIYKDIFKALKSDNAFLRRGLYYTQLKRYFKLFSKENILILFYNDLMKNPNIFMKKIYKFLGLNNKEYESSYLKKKTNVTGKIMVEYKIPLLIPSIYWIQKKIIDKNELLKKLVNRLAIKELIVKFIEVFTKNVVNYEKISDFNNNKKFELEKNIYKYYKNDINSLEILLDKDLSFWKKDEFR